MSVFARLPVMLPKKFFTKWRNVTPRPSAIAGRYICWLKLPGRGDDLDADGHALLTLPSSASVLPCLERDRTTSAVTTMLAIETGSRRFQPRLIS